eukprot:12256063-Heterocapsa_arctica.AAC.1
MGGACTSSALAARLDEQVTGACSDGEVVLRVRGYDERGREAVSIFRSRGGCALKMIWKNWMLRLR